MITANREMFNARCIKQIGNFEKGQKYYVSTRAMTGKRYKPGKDSTGEWVDKIGFPENRVMIFP